MQAKEIKRLITESVKEVLRQRIDDPSSEPVRESVAKTPTNKLKHFCTVRETLSTEGKKKLLKALKLLREVESSPIDHNALDEESTSSEQNVVAKTFDTTSDFDSYINQRRGIEMTVKEQQAIAGYKQVKPTQQDKFFIKYETTDDFGHNTTVVVKKLKEGNQFCWTAFKKVESAEEEGGQDSVDEVNVPPSSHGAAPSQPQKQASQPQPTPAATNQSTPNNPTTPEEPEEVEADDKIRIIKSITFNNDVDGASVLSEFLRKLDI